MALSSVRGRFDPRLRVRRIERIRTKKRRFGVITASSMSPMPWSLASLLEGFDPGRWS